MEGSWGLVGGLVVYLGLGLEGRLGELFLGGHFYSALLRDQVVGTCATLGSKLLDDHVKIIIGLLFDDFRGWSIDVHFQVKHFIRIDVAFIV